MPLDAEVLLGCEERGGVVITGLSTCHACGEVQGPEFRGEPGF